MSKLKGYLTVAAVVVGLGAPIVGFVLWEDSAARKRLSAEAEPVGLAAIPVEWEEGGEDGGTEHGYDLTFAWVDGQNQVHTEKMERITWYEEGARYKVCFDPKNPTDWRMYEASTRCGR